MRFLAGKNGNREKMIDARECLYIADQIEKAHAIGEIIENQYGALAYVPEWRDLIVKALRAYSQPDSVGD